MFHITENDFSYHNTYNTWIGEPCSNSSCSFRTNTIGKGMNLHFLHSLPPPDILKKTMTWTNRFPIITLSPQAVTDNCYISYQIWQDLVIHLKHNIFNERRNQTLLPEKDLTGCVWLNHDFPGQNNLFFWSIIL